MQLNKISIKKLLELLWTLSIVFYLLRSIFEPLKYIAAGSLSLLFITEVFYLIANIKKSFFLDFFKVSREYILLLLFVVVGIISSSSISIHTIKEIANSIIILFLVFIIIHVKRKIITLTFFKIWLIIHGTI